MKTIERFQLSVPIAIESLKMIVADSIINKTKVTDKKEFNNTCTGTRTIQLDRECKILVFSRVSNSRTLLRIDCVQNRLLRDI